MKLQPVEKKSEQDYPFFDEYWKNRRKYLTEAALCAGIVLGSGMLTSCGQTDVHPTGTPVAPVAPSPQQNDVPPETGEKPKAPTRVKKCGEMVAPQKPVKIERDIPQAEGKMMEPKRPEIKNPVVPVKREAMIDGDVFYPDPPKKNEPKPPKKK